MCSLYALECIVTSPYACRQPPPPLKSNSNRCMASWCTRGEIESLLGVQRQALFGAASLFWSCVARFDAKYERRAREHNAARNSVLNTDLEACVFARCYRVAEEECASQEEREPAGRPSVWTSQRNRHAREHHADRHDVLDANFQTCVPS